MKRCGWENSEEMIIYHDNEWGKPVYDDKKLFEFLTLEGMQAGLSWSTILSKRESFRKAFDDYDLDLIKNYNEDKLNSLYDNKDIIRNKLKIKSVVNNAKCFIEVQKEFGSFSKSIWQFVNNKQVINNFKKLSDVPVLTQESINMSKDLKRRGFKFVGPTICYAYMQAVGLVNDHLIDCDYK